MKKALTKVKSKNKVPAPGEASVPARAFQDFFANWKLAKESTRHDLVSVLKAGLKEKNLNSVAFSNYLQAKNIFIPISLEKSLLSWLKKQKGKTYEKWLKSYATDKKEAEKNLKNDFVQRVRSLHQDSGLSSKAWGAWLQPKLAAKKLEVSQREILSWLQKAPSTLDAGVYEFIQQIKGPKKVSVKVPVVPTKVVKPSPKLEDKKSKAEVEAKAKLQSKASKKAASAALDSELALQLESFAKQGRPSIKKKVMEAFQKLTQATSREKKNLQHVYLTAREELIKKRWSQKFGKKSAKSNSRAKSVSELIEEIDLQDSLLDEGGSAEDVEVAYDVGGGIDRLVS